MAKATTPKKYRERLALTNAELQAEELDFKDQESKLQLQSDILQTSKHISEQKRKLQTLKNTHPLNTAEIVKLTAEIQASEKGLVIAKELEAELF